MSYEGFCACGFCGLDVIMGGLDVGEVREEDARERRDQTRFCASPLASKVP
jgi:hypothetical protein